MTIALKMDRGLLASLLPLVAAILLAANLSFVNEQAQHGSRFIVLHLKAILLSVPYLTSVGLLSCLHRPWGALVWFSVCLLYSLFLFSANLPSELLLPFSAQPPQPTAASIVSSADSLTKLDSHTKLDSQIIWFFIVGALLGGLHHFHKTPSSGNVKSALWVQRVFSLDAMVAATLFIWVIGCTGIFLYTPDPMNNQPLAMKVDLNQVVGEFDRFVAYFFQFLWLAAILFFIYWVNRYWLIRRVLSSQGLIPYAATALVFILLATPVLSASALLLPLNTQSSLTLLPSENSNAFDLDNFRFMFAFLAVTMPVILAFERKSFDATLARVEKDKVRTELQLLQQQINPHFLFNTLNNLYALTLEKSDRAPTSIEHLSNLLRYTVYKGQQEWVALEDELAYVNDYLALQGLRYQSDCEINVSWPTCNKGYQIPPLLLIVLLENAFKHGIEKAEKPSVLNVSIRIDECGVLHFSCQSPYLAEGALSQPEHAIWSGSQQASQTGLGLTNVARRLSLLPGEHNTLDNDVIEGTWVASLTLDLQPC